MDKNLKWVNEQRILRTIKSLQKNNISGYLVDSKEDVIDKIKELIIERATIACGGSVTLDETGVIDYLRCGKYNFLDRYKEGLCREEIVEIFKQSFLADVYITSSNAITEEGELYNVDGNGNRVAAMLYGPDKVIVVCGVNKIVKDLDEAIIRNEKYSAPTNATRLNRKTPCTKVGHCLDCESAERICNVYTLIKKQVIADRIHVIFVNESLGY